VSLEIPMFLNDKRLRVASRKPMTERFSSLISTDMFDVEQTVNVRLRGAQ